MGLDRFPFLLVGHAPLHQVAGPCQMGSVVVLVLFDQPEHDPVGFLDVIHARVQLGQLDVAGTVGGGMGDGSQVQGDGAVILVFRGAAKGAELFETAVVGAGAFQQGPEMFQGVVEAAHAQGNVHGLAAQVVILRLLT